LTVIFGSSGRQASRRADAHRVRHPSRGHEQTAVGEIRGLRRNRPEGCDAVRGPTAKQQGFDCAIAQGIACGLAAAREAGERKIKREAGAGEAVGPDVRAIPSRRGERNSLARISSAARQRAEISAS
jgi:hypothetical protein